MLSHVKENFCYKCPVLSCVYSSKWNSDLTKHMYIHNGEKPHKCEECDVFFSSKPGLTRHQENNHSADGIQRKHKEEEAIKKFLIKHNIPFDREVYIYTSSCFSDAQKKCARVDFYVLFYPDRIDILEVDETTRRLSDLV